MDYVWTGDAVDDDGDNNGWYDIEYIEDSSPPMYASNWGTVGDPPEFPNSSSADVTISKPVGGWTAVLGHAASIRVLTIGTDDDLTIHSVLTVHGSSINNAGNLGVAQQFVITNLRVNQN